MKKLNEPLIALVDENDQIIGYDEKMNIHQMGKLHRAFSVFVFNKKGEMLLQQRAFHKYHSPGLWTNTCCSHLLEGLDMEACVHDRLKFEMGFDTSVHFKFKFKYIAHFDNGLTEHEIDHVYFGQYNDNPPFNPDEVATFRWISIDNLKLEMDKYPEQFTYWFKHIINTVEQEWDNSGIVQN